MSIHTLVEDIVVRSKVEVLAPAGQPTESVIRIARKEMDRVCEQVGLIPPATDINISPPVYLDGRKWEVSAMYRFRSTTIVDLKE